ncbi:Uncharacterized protein FWK35_00001212 [Aphis craccivora]|uniref:Uncharacterized protein n=1 Tax=Aphis craccivora TaxID=307492 RepID=A0A6G0ZM86_APHCR|nr:Uncharacterized protein FWK35_00001212 [Aphis craccivora]
MIEKNIGIANILSYIRENGTSIEHNLEKCTRLKSKIVSIKPLYNVCVISETIIIRIRSADSDEARVIRFTMGSLAVKTLHDLHFTRSNMNFSIIKML